MVNFLKIVLVTSKHIPVVFIFLCKLLESIGVECVLTVQLSLQILSMTLQPATLTI
jgi:hypothetical protein